VRLVVLALAFCSACVDLSATQAMPETELEPFVDLAQPVLGARCANASCHGNGERPLAVFEVHRYRLSDDDTFVDTPLTDEELRLNLLRAALFTADIEHAAESLLVVKPRSRHADVEVFVDDADFDYRRLVAWVDGVAQASP